MSYRIPCREERLIIRLFSAIQCPLLTTQAPSYALIISNNLSYRKTYHTSAIIWVRLFSHFIMIRRVMLNVNMYLICYTSKLSLLCEYSKQLRRFQLRICLAIIFVKLKNSQAFVIFVCTMFDLVPTLQNGEVCRMTSTSYLHKHEGVSFEMILIDSNLRVV